MREFLTKPESIVVIVFCLLFWTCVSACVWYFRKRIIEDVNRDIRIGFRRTRNRLKEEFKDGLTYSKLEPPKDIGDGRCF